MTYSGDYVQSYVCPHCDAKVPIVQRGMTYIAGDQTWYQVVGCGNNDCQKGTTFVYETVSHSGADYGLRLIHQYPVKEGTTHESIPEEISESYKQGVRCLSAQSPIGSVTCLRRALQQICEEKGTQQSRLVDQIDEILPDYLQEQAHEIRLWGNLGAHPDEIIKDVSKEDAIEIKDLLDSIFDALYITPFKVQERRNKRNST